MKNRPHKKERIHKSHSGTNRETKGHADNRTMSNTTVIIICMIVPLLLSGFANFYAHKWWILYLPLLGILLLIGYLGHIGIRAAGEARQERPETTTPFPPVAPSPTSATKRAPRLLKSTEASPFDAPTKSTPTPSVIRAIVPPSPPKTAAPTATVPTPESTLPKPIELTPWQMMDRIESASASNRDEVAAGFIGRPIVPDWTLFFWSANRIGSENEVMLVFFWNGDKNNLLNAVSCEVPTKGHEHLPTMEKTDQFRVRGTVESARTYSIHLKDASIEQLPNSPQ